MRLTLCLLAAATMLTGCATDKLLDDQKARLENCPAAIDLSTYKSVITANIAKLKPIVGPLTLEGSKGPLTMTSAATLHKNVLDHYVCHWAAVLPADKRGELVKAKFVWIAALDEFYSDIATKANSDKVATKEVIDKAAATAIASGAKDDTKWSDFPPVPLAIQKQVLPSIDYLSKFDIKLSVENAVTGNGGSIELSKSVADILSGDFLFALQSIPDPIRQAANDPTVYSKFIFNTIISNARIVATTTYITQ